MKSNRHFLTTLFIVLLLGSLVMGCAAQKESGYSSGDGSNGMEESKQTTIEFVYWASAGGEEEGFNKLIEAFEAEHPDIKVNAQQVPSGTEYHTRMRTRIAGNDAPDVFRVQYQRIGEYASQNALLDITDIMEDELENFNPSLLSAVTLEDRIYGLPHHTDTLAIFYNKTYLDELGITPPDTLNEAWSWEEFLDVASQIQDAGLAEYGIAYNWVESSAYRALPFLYHNGASLLTDDLSEANLQTPEAIEAITFLQDMYTNYMSPGNSMRGSDDFNLLFTTGTAGMLVTGNWMIPRYEEEMDQYEWGVTYMTMREEAASDLGGNALAIPSNAKNIEAAKKFVAFMGDKENMKAFVEDGLFIPARLDIEEPIHYNMENPELMELFIEQALTVPEELAKTVTHPNFARINQALAEELEELFVMGKTPEEFANSLTDKINTILDSH